MARSLALIIGSARVLSASAANYDYDCEAGYDRWQTEWTDAKKRWCCEYDSRGCHGDTTVDAFNCFNNPHNFKQAWSETKQEWCCENSRRWSDDHQGFCCELKKGCHVSGGIVFDCNAGKDNLAGWSMEKKHYCCQKDNIGCEQLFDCQAGLQMAETGWSDQKKEWCCSQRNLGCPTHCDDYANRRNWPRHKVCYCCKHRGIACPPVYYPPNIPEHAVVCPNVPSYPTLYEVDDTLSDAASDDDVTFKVAPRRSLGVLAAGGVLALALGIFALMAVRAGFRRVCRVRYSTLNEKTGAGAEKQQLEDVTELVS
uniref:Uncharacterized protein n=1 Tax=Alexandrium monilatum TaxID=311494 RepID=A0A7S4UGW8_9DINO|mmetsp:Transcript_64290/g.191588  ORF Transcript_64290/g.191588 Transcript_64290/m.191588 type:complete len:312 (+) Transcript_64290:84-1019(+)